jgi:predicted phage gp36 major capsid-like protein
METAVSFSTASNDDCLVLGSYDQYVVVDRLGTTVAFNPLVIGTSRRPTGSVGWFLYWRTGGDAVVADAWRMLRL